MTHDRWESPLITHLQRCEGKVVNFNVMCYCVSLIDIKLVNYVFLLKPTLSSVDT